MERLRVLAMRDRDTVRDALTDAVNRHRVGVASAASVAASAASVSSGSASASASASVTAAASTSASSSTATPRPPPSTQVKLTKEEIRARQALLAKNAPLRKRI